MKNAILVVLDTSVLRKNPFLTKEMGYWLKSLAEKKKVEIHLPYIVKNEIITQFTAHYQEESIDAYDKFSKVLKKNNISEALGSLLVTLQSEVEQLFNEKKRYLEEFYNSEIFIIDSIEAADTFNVFNNYFKGKGNFTKIKNREDLPDGFIFELVRRLSSDKEILFLSDDKALVKALCCISNVKIYTSIEDAFKVDSRLITEKDSIEKIENHRIETEIIEKAIDIDIYMSHIDSNLIFEEVTDKLYREKLNEDYEEAYINEVHRLHCDPGNIKLEYLEAGKGRLELKIEAFVEVEHFVERSEVRDLFDQKNIHIEQINDYVYQVNEPARVIVNVESSFQVDYSLLQKAIDEQWSGRNLGYELGAKISHSLDILDIELIEFTAREHEIFEGEDSEYENYCTRCGEPVGTCEH